MSGDTADLTLGDILDPSGGNDRPFGEYAEGLDVHVYNPFFREPWRHVCRTCGAGNLVWTRRGRQWRFMHADTRKLHRCPSVTCRNCGRQRLYWELQDGARWRLFDAEGNLHACPVRPLAAKPPAPAGAAGFLLNRLAKARYVLLAIPGDPPVMLPIDVDLLRRLLAHPDKGPPLAARLQYDDSRLQNGRLYLRPTPIDSSPFLPPPAGRRR